MTKQSRFHGVYWDKYGKKWVAAIYVDGQQRHVGRFTDEQEAAKARDAAHITAGGATRKLNFPISEERQ